MDRRRYLAILRRQVVLVLLCTVAAGALAAAWSIGTPKRYEATAWVTVGIDQAANLQVQGTPTDSRSLAFDAQQSTGTAVAERVAKTTGRPRAEVREGVTSRVGRLPGQILITAEGETAEASAAKANAFALAFLAIRKENGPLALQAAVTALDARIADVQGQIDRVTRELVGTGASGSGSGSGSGLGTATTLRADAEVKRNQLAAASQLYQSLFSKQQDLLYRIAISGGDAVVTQEAEPPGEPVSPRPIRDTVLGLMLGLIIGCAAALIRERLNDKVGAREELEADVAQPILAEVPIDREAYHSIGNLALVSEHQQGPVSEAIRSLRSSIQFLGVDQPIKRIVVCSGSPNEGKSYVAANLAVAFAQAGFATTLVSSDLRKPGLDRMFPREASRSRGLSSVIGLGQRDGGSLADEAAALAEPTGIPGLSFVAAGPPPPNAGELLAGRRAQEVLNVIARGAEIVVFDSPPLLAVSDGAVLAAQADGVVLVAAKAFTRRTALRRSIELLETANARIVGLVLNRGDAPGEQYSSYYYGVETPRGRKGRKAAADAAVDGDREPEPADRA